MAVVLGRMVSFPRVGAAGASSTATASNGTTAGEIGAATFTASGAAVTASTFHRIDRHNREGHRPGRGSNPAGIHV